MDDHRKREARDLIIHNLTQYPLASKVHMHLHTYYGEPEKAREIMQAVDSIPPNQHGTTPIIDIESRLQTLATTLADLLLTEPNSDTPKRPMTHATRTLALLLAMLLTTHTTTLHSASLHLHVQESTRTTSDNRPCLTVQGRGHKNNYDYAKSISLTNIPFTDTDAQEKTVPHIRIKHQANHSKMRMGIYRAHAYKIGNHPTNMRPSVWYPTNMMPSVWDGTSNAWNDAPQIIEHLWISAPVTETGNTDIQNPELWQLRNAVQTEFTLDVNMNTDRDNLPKHTFPNQYWDNKGSGYRSGVDCPIPNNIGYRYVLYLEEYHATRTTNLNIGNTPITIPAQEWYHLHTIVSNIYKFPTPIQDTRAQTFTATDALIMYYTYTLGNLLGDGSPYIGSKHLRRTLIGSILNTNDDATIRSHISTARALHKYWTPPTD